MRRGTPVEELTAQERAEGTYIEAIFVGAYWGARPEAPGAVAGRFRAALSGLEDLGLTMGEPWWHHGVRLPLGEDDLAALVARGVNRDERTNTVYKSLGYGVSAYTGPAPRDERGVGVMAHAGSTAGHNSVVVEPCRLEDYTALAGQAGAVVRLLAEAWAPDWAIFTRSDLVEAVDGGKGDPYPGALTWFADRDGDSLALSAAEVGAEVQRPDCLAGRSRPSPAGRL